MRTPRRFPIPNDCVRCELRRTCDFCDFQGPLQDQFRLTGHTTFYPPHATLLVEGQVPRGIHIICSGRVKLSVEARSGKTIILKIAENRDVVGLSALLSQGPSLVTVTTLEICQIKFVERDSLVALMERDARVARAAAARLGRDVATSFDDVHELLLARSSTEKLARLLLSWVADEPRNRELRVPAEFTHEEMAQMIGASRETVTRLLSDWKRKDLLRQDGETLVIQNRIALQAITT